MPSLTTSLDSGLKWCSGRKDRSNMPSSVPVKMQAKTMQLIESELMNPMSPNCGVPALTSNDKIAGRVGEGNGPYLPDLERIG